MLILTGAAKMPRFLANRRYATWVEVLIGLAVAGCVSSAGVPEFQIYRDAFDRANAVSDELLDELAVAERDKARRLFAQGQSPSPEAPPVGETRTSRDTIIASGFDEQFYVEDARYNSRIGDPPATAAFRRSLAAVASFNDIALAYAQGEALDELKQEAAFLGTQASSALALVTGAAGVGAVSVPGVAPALQLVSEGADVALQAASRDAFRAAVLKQEPQIEQILVGVRDAAPAMFGLLTSDLAAQAKDAADEGDERTAQAAIARIETYRELLSDWVVLLDDSRTALHAATAAMRSPRGTTAIIRDLNSTAADLTLRSQRISQLLVALRRGPVT